jgi:hypothetical protein
MEVSGQLHAPAALPPGKSPWYPLDRRLGGPQSRSGRGGEEKNFLLPPGTEPFFFEVPPLASDALLATLHPLLESVLQTVDDFEISCL